MGALRDILGITWSLVLFLCSFVCPGCATRRLVRGLADRGESRGAVAYMLLVKAGARVRPHLVRAARAGRQTAGVLQILGDQGDPAVLPELERYVASQDPRVAEAARTAIEIIGISQSGS